MVKLVTLLEQHMDKQPPTVVIQATIWWEAVVLLSHVKLQECGLGVHLPESMLLLLGYVYVHSGVRHTNQLSAH